MDQEKPNKEPSEEVISMDELTEILAEATGVTPLEILQGAEEMEIAPPEQATVIKEYSKKTAHMMWKYRNQYPSLTYNIDKRCE